MIEALSDWNSWWTSGKIDDELLGKERDLTKRADELFSYKEIKTLVGMRRSGKSTLLYQFIKHLLDEEVDPRLILFVNFEDPVLSKSTLEEIFDAYQENINPDKDPYIFLDEVHRCEEWVLFLRKLYDLKKVEQIFITDSSSKIIKKDYASVLTGRNLTILVHPLSFKEYLDWMEIDSCPPYSREDKNKIKNSLKTYLRWGGLPEIVLKTSDMQKKTLLNNYLSDIVHRDIVERYNTNYKKIKNLIDYLVSNTGFLFSPRKYSRTYGLSLDTLNNYIGYLEEIFLFDFIPKFDYSIRKQQLSSKKTYIMDVGYFGTTGFHVSENKGQVYENAVFLHLFQKDREIFYWKNGGECDFLVKEGIEVTDAVQVCSDLTSRTEDREIKGLLEALDEFELEEGIIVTSKKEGEEKTEGKKVRYIPLWRFLLDSEE
ncbi:MAG: ATP-binding protein [Thermoplasmata archaeon]